MGLQPCSGAIERLEGGEVKVDCLLVDNLLDAATLDLTFHSNGFLRLHGLVGFDRHAA